MEHTTTTAGGWVDIWRRFSELTEPVERVGQTDPAAALRLLNGACPLLDETIDALVAQARRQGTTWQEIATAMGIENRQGAQRRWGRSEKRS